MMDAPRVNTHNFSDDTSDITLAKTHKSRPKLNIIDSDSDGETQEEIFESNSRKSSDSERENEVNLNAKKSRRVVVLASDSDDGSGAPSANLEEVTSEGSFAEVTFHNKSFSDEARPPETVTYTTNSKGALIPENEADKAAQKARLATLCDSDSDSAVSADEVIEPIIYKPVRRRSDRDNPRTMTPREAAQQRIEIQSESQRMLRESNVSLPYHKPKSYTIKEFFEKRPKLASTLPQRPRAPLPVAIKMSKDQLMEVSKKLDERIKEVEEFYKSESDDDGDGDDKEREETINVMKGWLDVLLVAAMDSVDKCEENEIDAEEATESMEYEFNLDDVNECEKPASTKSKIADLLQEVLIMQPKLSGGPDDVIDLETGTSKLSNVRKLFDKFLLQHAIKSKPQKHKVELDIVGLGKGGEIVKETVSMNVDEEVGENVIIETPGAKLQKLRAELEVQMAEKRLELWKQKHEQGDTLTSDQEKAEISHEKTVLDDEDEEELEMAESDEDEASEAEFIDGEADEEGASPEIDPPSPVSAERKPLKRIVQAFAEDSDDDDEPPPHPPKPDFIIRSVGDDDRLSPNLPRANVTPQKALLPTQKSDFEFLTPVTYLTGLQNLNCSTKQTPNAVVSPFSTLSQASPFKEKTFPKKLFEENSESTQNIEDLAQLCSGLFSQTPSQEINEEAATTQDLLNLCSGAFDTIPDTTGSKPEVKNYETIQPNPDKEIKTLEEDDPIISQLLDEAELERFKKKFESPINLFHKRSVLAEFEESVGEVNATGLLNSDDEDEGLELKSRKRHQKLVFSDEEDDDENQSEDEQDEEEIDLHDNVDEDDEEQQMERAIVEEASRNYKAADFVENEAELSESEMGSEDEDEKGLDMWEEEEGDKDVFNEKKMRTELERIHMRQILDEDNREVKLLQEILLEDGDMHGSGRQRQFRWKTLYSEDNGEFDKRPDDDIFMDDEEESEEQYRKMRHKREIFLKKKSESDDVDSILSDSQILNLGKPIVIKTNRSQTSENNTPVEKTDGVKEPLSLLGKRGSFLSRNDQVLQRLVEYNKVTSMTSTAKSNSRGFVFQTVELSDRLVKESNNKRKASDGTPLAIKKLRLDDLSPAGNSNKGKARKLFGGKSW